jgi:hypothetical protein
MPLSGSTDPSPICSRSYSLLRSHMMRILAIALAGLLLSSSGVRNKRSAGETLSCPSFSTRHWWGCRCREGRCSDNGGLTWQCPDKDGYLGGGYFSPACTNCKCYPDRRAPSPPCPDSATGPSWDGDCVCKQGRCSQDGGLTFLCPTSRTPGNFATRGFLAKCDDCQCIVNPTPAPTPVIKTCPSGAVRNTRGPDCICPGGSRCSRDGGVTFDNCPSPGGRVGSFWPSCLDCQCLVPPTPAPSPDRDTCPSFTWGPSSGYCRCKTGYCTRDGGLTFRCPDAYVFAERRVQYFHTTCTDCECMALPPPTPRPTPAPTPPAPTCPSFSTGPDKEGDCRCTYGSCSRDGGSTFMCPTSGRAGGYWGHYFLPSCTDCQCHP